ncbi:MAG: NADH-quinone oxidoreductase subunit A [Rickettsiales bacterium]|nr:MAG: NADH-quinone oxidoreductase subunit A [Rickettsiales bacterium]
MGTVVIFIFAPVLVGILLALNPLISLSPLSRSRGYGDKVSSYECGFSNLSGQTRAPVTISFYIVAILYLIFDLEIALMIPIIPTLDVMGVSSF